MEIKEEPFDDEPQNVIKIPSTPTSDTLQVEIKEEDIEQSETELSSHFVAENSRSNERKYKKPMPEEPFDENPQNCIETPSTPSPERLQLEIKEEDIEQTELDLSPDIVEEENSRSNETQHEEPFDEEPQNVIEVPSTLNSSPEILHVEIKEEDIEQSETELSPDIVEEENSRNNETQDEEPMPVQTEKIVARLYYYLKKEYELLEKNNPKCDLGPLTNILQRTADATKLSVEDVLEILKEYPEVPSAPEEAYAHEDTEELLTENHSMSKRKRR